MIESGGTDAGAVPARAGFIVGVPRSGTTMLVSLLDGHPQAAILPYETKVFEWHDQPDPVAALLAGTGFGRVFSEVGTDEARDEQVPLAVVLSLGAALVARLDGFDLLAVKGYVKRAVATANADVANHLLHRTSMRRWSLLRLP